MHVTQVSEKIAGKHQARRQQRIEGYRELVAVIAGGEEPDMGRLETVLAEANKSFDDLKRDVELYQRRMALKASVAMLPKLEEQRAQVQQQIAAADRDPEDAEKRHDDVTAPLSAQIRELDAARSDAEAAQRELYETCDEPEFRAQLQALTAEAQQLAQQRQDLTNHAAYLDDKSRTELDRAERELTEGDREHRREQSALYAKQAESLRGQIKAVAATERFRRPTGWSSRLVPARDSRGVVAVRTMFESVAGGASRGAVARELNRQGIRTMFSKRFNATSIRRTVSNATYIGKIVAGRRRRGKFRSLHDEGGVVCEDAHEPLVTQALFNRAQRMLERNHKPSRTATPGKYLLTGLIFLADGRRLRGCAMRQAKRRAWRRYYAWPPSVFEQYPEETDRPSFHADTIERAVVAKLQVFMADERTKRAIRSEISRRTKKGDANVGRLESQLADVRARIERGTRHRALANCLRAAPVGARRAQW